MRGLSEISTVYLHREAVDFRKAINGLVVIVEQEMQLSPYADAVFVFCNRARDKLKVVYWERIAISNEVVATFVWLKEITDDPGGLPQLIDGAWFEPFHMRLEF